jgi:hypothetical protein
MTYPIADVAELADAQVSEACDGDIVEVQVLSSAPEVGKLGEPVSRACLFYVCPRGTKSMLGKKLVTEMAALVSKVVRG